MRTSWLAGESETTQGCREPGDPAAGLRCQGSTSSSELPDVLPDELRDGRFAVKLGWARFNAGRGIVAEWGLAEAAERAAAAGNRVAELGLRLERENLQSVLEPPTDRTSARLRGFAEEALPVFEAARDEWGFTVACASLLIAEIADGRSWANVAAVAQRMLGHARRADYPLFVDWGATQLVYAQYYGATPVDEAVRWLDEHPEVERRAVLPYRDRLLAMLGRFDEAHRLPPQQRIGWRSSVLSGQRSGWRRVASPYEAMLEGDAAHAEQAAREACEE